ncbi:hypothetical protein GCM10009069_28270 [Algimonas arctica]|uniref:Potassium efflux system protein n=1 Tax=Algimonas arctica TaxID=1479486 RepID=A0A8J3CU69_9PROT|nr:mechanosensitive ion channel domain-containing protein [Algimonas arctica]GHB04019.1 hypothetical protein GCM10009069_28270 [Algimonas arctica]
MKILTTAPKVILCSCAGLLFSLLIAVSAFAQFTDMTSDEFAVALFEISASTDQDATEITSIISSSEAALDDLIKFEAQREAYAATMATRESQIKALSTLMGDMADKYPMPDSDQATNVLKDRLQQYQSEQESVTAQISILKKGLSELARRGAVISEDLIQARERINGVPVAETSATDMGDVETKARNLFLAITRARNLTRAEMYEKELESLPVRQSILEQRIRVESQRLTFLKRLTETIRIELKQSDLRQARLRVDDLERRIDNAQTIEETRQLETNLALSRQLTTLTESYYDELSLVISTDEKIADADKSMRLVERIVAAGRADGELGDILRRLRSDLPSPLEITVAIKDLQSRQINLQLESIVWEDQYDEMSDSLGNDITLSDFEILESRRSTLSELTAMAVRLDANQTNRRVKLDVLDVKTRSLRRALDGRLLWLPTNKSLDGTWFEQISTSAQSFLSPRNWSITARDVLENSAKRNALTVILLLISLGLFALRKRFNARFKDISLKLHRVDTDAQWLTPYVLLIGALNVAALPIAIFALANLLGDPDLVFPNAIFVALRNTAIVVFIFTYFSALAAPCGAIDKHFRWSTRPREVLHQNLKWLAVLMPIGAFFYNYAITMDDAANEYGLGRIAFIFISIILSVAGFRILRPKSEVSKHMFGNLSYKSVGFIVFALFAGLPLFLASLTLFGYFDTAMILQSKLFISALLILLASLLYGVLSRTYEVTERHAARSRAFIRHQSALEAKQNEDDLAGDNLPTFDPADFDNVEAINKEAKTFIWLITSAALLFGLYMIWKSILPAFDITNSIVLWEGVRTVDGVATSQPVSLSDLVFAFFAVFMGFFLARNMRGLFALGIAQKIDMRPGSRFAASTIIGYVLVSAAVLFALNKIGLDWSKLQWIAAALSVGLGFGLGEIVSNFVSGIIILLERPIRVGDVVTVGGIDGTVSNISIRATTITDFERREVLIPNKVIIAENVTNWTLNDSVTRLLITIGIGYDSDLELARGIMIDVVTQHPDVLEDPAPSVFFIEHADSTLNYEIRAYVASISKRLATKNDIHSEVHTRLQAAGIDLAFPQRDIHIIRKPRKPTRPDAPEVKPISTDEK